MSAAMPSPWRHPVTDIFYLRVRVPADVRQFDRREIAKKSLKTKDCKVAKQRFAQEHAALLTEWNRLRAANAGRLSKAEPEIGAGKGETRVIALTDRDAHEIAEFTYDQWLARHWDNPSDERAWSTDLFKDLWAQKSINFDNITGKVILDASPIATRRLQLQEWCFREADDRLFMQDIVVDDTSRYRLARAISAQISRANTLLDRLAKGDLGSYSMPRPGSASPFWTKLYPSPSSTTSHPVPFSELLNGWSAERGLPPKTIYEAKRIFKQLETFLGHDNALRICANDLNRWKADMIERGLKPKTIKDGKLAPIRAVLAWGVQNGRISLNAAASIKIEVRQRPGEGRRFFTDEEAKIILSAAQNELDPVRRWIPYICAYSGARLSEICQLRVQDIVEVGGIWSMQILAEAGSLKNLNSERTVPLHSQLLGAGFLGFVHSIKGEVLFPSLPPDKFGKRGGNGTKVLGRWIRNLGITDPRLAPNHSWRHRFATLARRYSIPTDIAHAITGHKHRTVGERYGEYELVTLKREIDKIPAQV